MIRNESAHAINGVSGRLFALHRPPAPWKAGTFANQTWKSESRAIEGYGTNGKMTVEVRFDDNCRNGHNSFAITATVITTESKHFRDIAAGGCMHDDIAQVFPELAPLIQFHLMSTDSPMHYVANACYHAGDRDCYGRAKGEPSNYEHGVKFGSSPMFHKLKDSFRAWLLSSEKVNAALPPGHPDRVQFEPVAVHHNDNKSGGYQFKDKFTFSGFNCQWYACPFDSLREANEFKAALKLPHEFVTVATEWSQGKERDFDAARNCALWPDATNEQLSLPRAELEALLLARLPALIAEFRAAIEAIGFMWQCPIELPKTGE